MPASLYRLAGRPHHSEVAAQPLVQVQVSQETVETVTEQVPVTEPEPIVEQTLDNSDAAVNDQPDSVEPTAEIQESDTPAWDVTWTKSQLLDVAVASGLPATSANTKSEIISLLNSKK